MTPWIIARQAPLSMGFSRQEYWSGLPCPPREDLPDPGIKSRSPSWQADSLPSELPGKPPDSEVLMSSVAPAVTQIRKHLNKTGGKKDIQIFIEVEREKETRVKRRTR